MQTISGKIIRSGTTPLSALDGSGATNGQVPTWNVTAGEYVPATLTGGGGSTTFSGVAGEDLADLASAYVELYGGAGTPGRIYNTDDAEAPKSSQSWFAGIVRGAATTGNPVSVQYAGIISGFTGLVAGRTYYVSSAGTISATPGANTLLVGVALTSTDLLLNNRGIQTILSPTVTYPTGGLLLYLDSRMGTGVSAGSPVSTWMDQSGNANHALVYSGSPALSASVFGTEPGVTFAGGDVMRVPYQASFQLTTMTMAYVVEWDSGASTWQNFFSRRAGAAASINWQSGFGPVASSQFDEYNGARAIYDPTALSAGNQRLFIMTGDGSGTRLYRSTTLLTSDANAPYNNATITNDISIGDSALGNGEYFHGRIGAIMLWNRVLSGTELSQVAAYLTGAFGVS